MHADIYMIFLSRSPGTQIVQSLDRRWMGLQTP